jgi:hypothetical protein
MAGSFEHMKMGRCIFIIVISNFFFYFKTYWNTVVYPEELGEFRDGI